LLKDAIEKIIENFRQAVEEIKANPQYLNDTASAPAVKLTSSLGLILAWVTMHSKILERFESQGYFGYDHFVRSNAYSAVLVTLLGLNVNAPDQNAQSILSLSGIQLVDQ
jgi:hypothetical protein